MIIFVHCCLLLGWKLDNNLVFHYQNLFWITILKIHITYLKYKTKFNLYLDIAIAMIIFSNRDKVRLYIVMLYYVIQFFVYMTTTRIDIIDFSFVYFFIANDSHSLSLVEDLFWTDNIFHFVSPENHTFYNSWFFFLPDDSFRDPSRFVNNFSKLTKEYLSGKENAPQPDPTGGNPFPDFYNGAIASTSAWNENENELNNNQNNFPLNIAESSTSNNRPAIHITPMMRSVNSKLLPTSTHEHVFSWSFYPNSKFFFPIYLAPNGEPCFFTPEGNLFFPGGSYGVFSFNPIFRDMNWNIIKDVTTCYNPQPQVFKGVLYRTPGSPKLPPTNIIKLSDKLVKRKVTIKSILHSISKFLNKKINK